MRVLMLTQVAPNPPDAGPKVKTHYVLRTLAREHEVELLTFARDEAEAEHARRLAPWCARVTIVPLRRRRQREPYYLARGWATGTPFLVARDARVAFTQALASRLASGEIAAVHADQLTMAQYLPLARAAGAWTVFDAHNAVWDLVRDLARRQPTPVHRLAAELEWRLLRRFEGAACRSSTLTLTVAPRDRALLTEAAGQPIHAATIPIGVEAEEVTPVATDPAATSLLSVATMHYPPNAEALRWFRDTVWPRVRAAHPAARVDVVGPRPPADLAQWAQADERAGVHGYVPDLAALYHAAAVFIVPLRSGSGVRVKILEAMARGIPVVSTTIGAAGLDLHDGQHLLIADTPGAFAEAVLTLLRDPARRTALAQAARARVLELYDWRRCCQPVLAQYERLGTIAVPQASAAPRMNAAPASRKGGIGDGG
ncbi:MAG: glycosyltransferase family 4 protein [Thermomicrobiales bacterium]